MVAVRHAPRERRRAVHGQSTNLERRQRESQSGTNAQVADGARVARRHAAVVARLGPVLLDDPFEDLVADGRQDGAGDPGQRLRVASHQERRGDGAAHGKPRRLADCLVQHGRVLCRGGDGPMDFWNGVAPRRRKRCGVHEQQQCQGAAVEHHASQGACWRSLRSLGR